MEHLTAEQLNLLISTTKEKNLLIVDVRKREEYRLDHIPGAVNIPLAEVEFDPFVFETDRKVVFYCRSGSRSQVAALFAAESGLPSHCIYNLKGGMLGYTGEILLDQPRVELFFPDMSQTQVMTRAINFEKGAFCFYQQIREIFSGTSLDETMAKMSQAEEGHARMIFQHLDTLSPAGSPFSVFFDQCKGDVLEGGKTLADAAGFLKSLGPDNRVDIIDFALELEYSAYDLYKTMAENSKAGPIKEMFFTLAQAEKNHLSMLIAVMDKSP